jgi:hypothetical protein
MDPPGTGEYWKIEGKQFYDYKHGNTVDVQSAFLRNIPSFRAADIKDVALSKGYVF